MSVDVASGVLRPDEIAGIGKSPEEATGLPARLYTDPEIYGVEKEKIFRREWMAVCHQTSVPNPGDFRVVDLAGESFLFVRTDDGELRCSHNICRHRGAKLAVGEGNCERFKCPYHAWTYDRRGRLIGAPEMAHVVREGIGLVEVPTDTWLGIVFINLDGKAEPLASKLSGLDEVLGPYLEVADDLEMLYELPYPGAWNWKLTNENAYEGYHVIGSHRESANWITPGDRAYTQTTDFRYYTDFFMPFEEGLNMRDPTGGTVPIENLPEWVDQELRFYVVWPNLIVFFVPEAILAAITIPGAGPDEVTFTWTSAVRPESKALPNFEQYRDGQREFSQTIQAEDQYPCETIFANLRSDAFIPGPYAAAERATYHFDQWYLERMAG